jgi:hypothetical protein
MLIMESDFEILASIKSQFRVNLIKAMNTPSWAIHALHRRRALDDQGLPTVRHGLDPANLGESRALLGSS